MKRTLTVFLGLLLAAAGAGCGREQHPQVAAPKAEAPKAPATKAEATKAPAMKAEAPKAATKTVFVPVEGMSCMVCATRIKKTVSALDGVSETYLDLAERRARVRYDPAKISPEDLAASINNLGYKAGKPQEVP